MDTLELPFDQYQRYRIIQEVVDAIRWQTSLKVLEVGGAGITLASFLAQDRVLVSGLKDQKELGLYTSGLALPFADASFDVVATADTLEHVAPVDRMRFLEELVRASREAVVLGAPFHDPEVVRAEEVFQSLILARYGEGYRFIEEHRGYGLPNIEETVEFFRRHGFQVVVLPNGYLPRWLVAISVYFLLQWRFHDSALSARMNSFYNANFYKSDNREPSYRKVIVAVRTRDVNRLQETLTQTEKGNETDRLLHMQILHMLVKVLTEEWSEKSKSLEKEVTTLLSQMAERDQNLLDSTKQLADREQAIKTLEKEGTSQLAVIEQRDQSLHDLAAQLSTEERRSADLAAQLSAEQQRSADLASQLSTEQQRSADLASQLSAEQQRSADLAAQLSAEQQRSADLASQLSTEQQRSADLASQLSAEQQRSADLAARLNDAERSNQSLVSQIQETENARQALAADVARRDRKITALKETVRITQDQVLDREHAIEILTSDANRKEQTIERLSGRLRVIEGSLGWRFIQSLYRAFLTIAPYGSNRWRILIGLFRTLGTNQPFPFRSRLKMQMQKGRDTLTSGKLEEAEQIFRSLQEILPTDPEVYRELAGVKIVRGEYPAATEILREGLVKQPENIDLKLQLGSIYLATGIFWKAEEVFQSVLQTDPKNREALNLLADIATSDARYGEAALHYRRVLDLDPENITALIGLSECAKYSKDAARTFSAAEPQFASNGFHPLRVLFSKSSSQAAPVLTSIVIPVFNNLEYTRNCIHAIREHTKDAVYELIVVDNASSDGTHEFLKSLPDVKTFRNPENVGFAAACNQGAALAFGKYIVFLNNDTIPQNGWLKHLVETAEFDSKVAAVGAKLLYPDGKLQEAGGIVFRDGSAWNYGRNEDPAAPQFNYLRDVSYCSAACLLVSRDVFQKVGGFDLRYSPAYFEDTDLAFAIRELGYRVVFQPLAEIIHYEGATSGTDLESGFKQYQSIHQEKFIEKWSARLGSQPAYDPQRIQAASNLKTGQRVLFVDHYLPTYDRSSGEHRIYQWLKILVNAGHHVTFVARNGEYQDRYRLALQQIGVETYAGDPERLDTGEYRPKARRLDFPQLLRDGHFSLAIISRYDNAQTYLPLIRKLAPDIPILVDSVDVHFVRALRKASLYEEESLRANAARIRDAELAIYKRANGIITVSEEDAAAIRAELGSDFPVWVVPNIHPVLQECKPFEARKDLVFVGNFVHPPNTDAMIYFFSRIFPLIRRHLPDVYTYVAGANSLTLMKRVSDQGMIITGYVPTVVPFLEACRVSVAPLRYGAGMKGKIGEAMAYGLPVATTSIGAEGLHLTDGIHALIGDDAETFAAAVVRAYSEEALWNRLSVEGRALIQSRFSPDAVRRTASQILNQMVK